MKFTHKFSAFFLALCIAASAFAITAIAAPDETVRHDVNMDGSFSVKDATDLQLYLADLKTDVNKDELDANRDGKVNIKDSTWLQKLIAGLVEETTAPETEATTAQPTTEEETEDEELPIEEVDIGEWL